MCGIVGIAAEAAVNNRAWLAVGRDAMHHRGPDDCGEWWSADGCVGLGHRRLAIIDLSPAGHQPMTASGGGLYIVFNGEIYNFPDLRRELIAKGHSFRSESDTEVILEAYQEWGAECLTRLNGMFAFALYDERRRRLFLARDRAGEKPLFYAARGGELRFASELKALMADPDFARRIDALALDCYLAMGFVPSPLCIMQGVNKLPPAHALFFDLLTAELKVWRYWQPPEPANRADAADETSLMERLEPLLEDAVRRQLVADVPVGVLLSGGVDSSLVTAMAVRTKPKVKTFTVRFPGHGKYDETEHARMIARHFGTEHIELDAGEVKVDLLPMLARQFDEPMVDSSMIPTYLLSRLVRQYCTVALGGDGGDELFAGYPHYNRLLWMRAKFGAVPPAVRRLLARTGNACLPLGFRGRNWLHALEVDLKEGLPLNSACFDRAWRRRLMSRRHRWILGAESVREGRIPRTTDLLYRATRMDFQNYLAEDILVKVDRASMLNSLEVRAPLLDYRLIEFAFGQVPSDLKGSVSTRKVLLKKLAARVLPPQFDQHRKQGFSIPLASWLRTDAWESFFKDILLSSDLFDRRAVGTVLNGQKRGLRNSERLFALTLLELWRGEYRVSL
ncbi:MAG: asparagine synthase (glutamine-hydrolyzing) [Steroidobacteraceae bacterium]